MTKLLIVLTHSTEDPDRAVGGLRTARAAQAEGHELALWLTGEGVRLGVKGVSETLREPGPETAAEITEALVGGGATFWLDAASFERREFSMDALREGAEVVPADKLGALIAMGWIPVSL